ncbi:MAG: MBL fold metallo-hydrolase, partial [Methanobrevibacter sp.]|nr:MBL fold metallo-hydrolase [Methanobrevibacter sp.]
HMCSTDFVKLIEEVKPQVAVMTHLGLKMISNNPVTEAKKISKRTGVKVIAAFDGLSFNVNYNNPKRFRLISLKDVDSVVHSTSHKMFKNERRNAYQQSFKNHEFDELSILKKNLD